MITKEGIIDFIIIIMALEMLFLLYIKQKTGGGPQIGEYLPHQLAGLFLLLALRSALTSSSMLLISSPLLGAFICHLFYLKTHLSKSTKIVFPKRKEAEKVKSNFIKIGTEP